MNIVNSCETSLSPHSGNSWTGTWSSWAARLQGKELFAHCNHQGRQLFLWPVLVIGVFPLLQSDLESLLFLISINVNVHSKTTDSNKLAPLLLAVQVLSHLHSYSYSVVHITCIIRINSTRWAMRWWWGTCCWRGPVRKKEPWRDRQVSHLYSSECLSTLRFGFWLCPNSQCGVDHTMDLVLNDFVYNGQTQDLFVSFCDSFPSGLHLAAESDSSEIASVLLNNG